MSKVTCGCCRHARLQANPKAGSQLEQKLSRITSVCGKERHFSPTCFLFLLIWNDHYGKPRFPHVFYTNKTKRIMCTSGKTFPLVPVCFSPTLVRFIFYISSDVLCKSPICLGGEVQKSTYRPYTLPDTCQQGSTIKNGAPILILV